MNITSVLLFISFFIVGHIFSKIPKDIDIDIENIDNADRESLKNAFIIIVNSYANMLLKYYGPKARYSFLYELNGISSNILFLYPKKRTGPQEKIEIHFSVEIEKDINVLSIEIKKYIEKILALMHHFFIFK